MEIKNNTQLEISANVETKKYLQKKINCLDLTIKKIEKEKQQLIIDAKTNDWSAKRLDYVDNRIKVLCNIGSGLLDIICMLGGDNK